MASSLPEFLLSFAWAILNTGSTQIAVRFLLVFSSQDVLASLFSLAELSFAPGLFSVLQSASPPLVSWFQSLPSEIPNHHWGVYVLVYTKSGHTSRIYIGSSVRVHQGLRQRIREHKRGIQAPRFIRIAIREGYTLSSTTLLAWCPTPSIGNRPRIRYMVVLLEAIFHCAFWSMNSRKWNFGFSDNCPWSLDSFEYTGLNSHNPLNESFWTADGLNFTPKELQAIEDKRQTSLKRGREKWREENREEEQRATKVRLQENKDAKKFYCAIYDVVCVDAYGLEVHNQTKRHQKWSETGGRPTSYDCTVCGHSFKWPYKLKEHMKKKH